MNELLYCDTMLEQGKVVPAAFLLYQAVSQISDSTPNSATVGPTTTQPVRVSLFLIWPPKIGRKFSKTKKTS